MIRLLFDLYEAQPFGNSKFHGGGEYIKAVFKHLVSNYNDAVNIAVYYNFDSFLDDWVKELIASYSLQSFDVKKRAEVGRIISNEKIDIWYSGIPYHYTRSDLGNAAILKGTIHGLRSIEMPTDKYAYLYVDGKKSVKEIIKYFVRSYYKKQEITSFGSCIEMLDELVCDSVHSKYSLVQKYPELRTKRVDIYYPPQKISTYAHNCEDDEEKYILLLGGDRWVKNTYRALKALDYLYAHHMINAYDVYVVGDISSKIKKRIESRSKIHVLEYVEAERLEKLYYNCSLLLYPSLNEGFGLPPLEAMKYGKTCIVSGVCSLPEICGDAAYYVNPTDCDEIATRILCALDHPIDREKAIWQYNKILQREMQDIEGLCQFIIRK